MPSTSAAEKEFSSFTFSNPNVNVVFDTLHQDQIDDPYYPDEDEKFVFAPTPTYKFKVYPIESYDPYLLAPSIQFSCSPGNGLKIKGTTRSKDNLINRFTALRADKPGDFQKFTMDHGFLFPVICDVGKQFNEIDYDDIIQLKERFNATIQLLRYARNSSRTPKDYQAIMYQIENVIFAEPVNILFGPYQYVSYEYSEFIADRNITKYLDQHELFVTSDAEPTDEIENMPNSISIFDFVIEDIVEYSKDEFCQFRALSETVTNGNGPRLRNFTNLYFSPLRKDSVYIDFLFHYYSDPQFYDKHEFTPEMKNAFEKLLNYVVSTEINHNIRDINIQCSLTDLSMSYSVPSLFSAMYWSLLYMRKHEVFRKCAHCGGFYIASETNQRRQYCSDRCRNAAHQQTYRNKKNEA